VLITEKSGAGAGDAWGVPVHPQKFGLVKHLSKSQKSLEKSFDIFDNINEIILCFLVYKQEFMMSDKTTLKRLFVSLATRAELCNCVLPMSDGSLL